MNIRTAILAGLLVAAALLWWGTLFRSGSKVEPIGTAAPFSPKAPSKKFLAELAKIREAEKTEDQVSRCLGYPGLPEFEWDPKIVDAQCRLLSRKMIAWSAIKDALDQKRPEILQNEFDSYSSRTFKPSEHGFLVWTYWWMFQNPSKDELETTNRWVNADATSAYALTARGTHHFAAASAARGGKYIKDTPAENLDRMNEQIALAKADLDAALKLNPKLIAAYHGLIRIAQLKGDDILRSSSIQAALRLDPADPWIYDDWMDSLQPNWGGSIEQMQHVADEAMLHADENPLLKLAQAAPVCYVAERLACRNCELRPDERSALEVFRKAAKFGPAKCFLSGAGSAAYRTLDYESAVLYYSQAMRFSGKHNHFAERASALQMLGQNEMALEDLTKALSSNPNNAYALEVQGYIHETSGRPKEAEKSYLALLQVDPQNEQGRLALGRLYLTGVPQPGKARLILSQLLERNPGLARAWLYMAMLDQGGDQAKCIQALENYVKYVDRTDSHEQVEIPRVERRLRELKGAH